MKKINVNNSFLSVACKLGEGIAWSEQTQSLFWVDVGNNYIYKYDTTQENMYTWKTPSMPVNIFLFDVPHTIMVALDKGLFLFNLETETWTEWLLIESEKPLNRLNDGGIDRQNRIWLGTMQNNVSPDGSPVSIGSLGSFYSVLSNKQVIRHDGDIGISNTLVFSPDYTKIYFADSLVRKIYQYSYNENEGTISDRRVFSDLGVDYGEPDGSATDEKGYVWNARWDAGAILRLNSNGEIDTLVFLPTSRPTNVCFGGKNYKTLFITTAQYGLEEAHAGDIYKVDVEVAGIRPPVLSSRDTVLIHER